MNVVAPPWGGATAYPLVSYGVYSSEPTYIQKWAISIPHVSHAISTSESRHIHQWATPYPPLSHAISISEPFHSHHWVTPYPAVNHAIFLLITHAVTKNHKPNHRQPVSHPPSVSNPISHTASILDYLYTRTFVHDSPRKPVTVWTPLRSRLLITFTG